MDWIYYENLLRLLRIHLPSVNHEITFLVFAQMSFWYCLDHFTWDCFRHSMILFAHSHCFHHDHKAGPIKALLCRLAQSLITDWIGWLRPQISLERSLKSRIYCRNYFRFVQLYWIFSTPQGPRWWLHFRDKFFLRSVRTPLNILARSPIEFSNSIGNGQIFFQFWGETRNNLILICTCVLSVSINTQASSTFYILFTFS